MGLRESGNRRPCRFLKAAGLAGTVMVSLLWSPARAQAPDKVEAGRELFLESCASCHGPEGEGGRYGPPIRDAGAAAADFFLRTGRMPLANPDAQAMPKPSAFSSSEMDDLVAYVASLGSGPAIPRVDPASGDVSEGQEIFVADCAPCHGATATGGAVGQGALAPTLLASQPVTIAEATIIGPGQMPRFDFSEDERNSIAAYVQYLQNAPDPGGEDIGGIGPVPEGFVAWVVGGVGVIVISIFIGRTRYREERR
jgi:ubiquinol-cytochrome c reductase cytochrome c subunit